jgi:hypothetical protein
MRVPEEFDVQIKLQRPDQAAGFVACSKLRLGKTLSMSDPLPDSEASKFVIALGKAMHHYAATEYLLNALISELVGDTIFTASFVAQSASKRIDTLSYRVGKWTICSLRRKLPFRTGTKLLTIRT